MQTRIKGSSRKSTEEKKQITRESIFNQIKYDETTKLIQAVNGYNGFDLFEENDHENFNKILQKSKHENGIQLEDLSTELLSTSIEEDKYKNKKEILDSTKEKNILKRTIKQYELFSDWDRGNYILAVGFLFTKVKENGRPIIYSQIRGALKDLYDFFLNTKHSFRISDVNDTTYSEFLQYIIKKGYYSSSFHKTPFEFVSKKYDHIFNNKKDVMTYSTFLEKVKAVNSFKEKLFDFDFAPRVKRKFKAIDFIDTSSVNIEKGGNKDHHLKVEEVKYLVEHKFENEELQLAVDGFLILIFCGGLRGVEKFDVEVEKEEEILDVLHTKNFKRVDIPIFNEMELILKKYNYTFPKFPKRENLLFNLKAAIKSLGWDRNIKTENTLVNRTTDDPYYFKKPLCDVINQTFARKTFVYYARWEFEMTDGEIIQYTGHSSVELLKFYMGDITAKERKEKMKNK